MLSQIKKTLNRSFLYQYLATEYKKMTVKINPLIEINRCYSASFNGKKINMDNPKNLIEKIYWMELYADTSLWSKCTDKYRMREYVQECGLEEYLPKNLGVWYNAEDISFDALPNEFILKTNNGCGDNYVVTNKIAWGGVQIDKIKKVFKHAMRLQRQGYSNAQLHYLNIKPCVIAEELLHQSEEEKQFSPSSLVDYKVWCINGKVEAVLVVFERKSHNDYKLSMFDSDWNNISAKTLKPEKHCYSGLDIPKPKCLDNMIQIAQQLAKPFVEVRVDFYNIDDKPILGELTFSTGYGYYTDEYYEYLGQKIDLSKVKKSDIPNYKKI